MLQGIRRPSIIDRSAVVSNSRLVLAAGCLTLVKAVFLELCLVKVYSMTASLELTVEAIFNFDVANDGYEIILG